MFKPPEGFQLPEGKKDGDTFSVLAEFKICGDKLCLQSIDENEVENTEEDSSENGEEGMMSETEKKYNGGMDEMMG